MSTVQHGAQESMSLPTGEVLTVATNTLAVGIVIRKARSAGGVDQSVTAIAGADLSFGPYAQTERFVVVCAAGSVVYTHGVADPALSATDAEVAASYATKAGTTTNDSASAGNV